MVNLHSKNNFITLLSLTCSNHVIFDIKNKSVDELREMGMEVVSELELEHLDNGDANI